MKKLSYLMIVLFLFNLIAQPATVSAQVNIPPGATITSAELSLYVFTTSQKPVTVHRITSPWAENGVTWNSFAAAYNPAVIDGYTPTASGWQTVDVSDTVQGFVDGTVPNFGFLLVESPPPTELGELTRYHSSEYGTADLRPKLDVCYTAPGVSETCVTIQRSDSEPDAVADTYIRSDRANENFGTDVTLYTNKRNAYEKQLLIKFNFSSDNPEVSIIKYTNDQVASDPNGTDVPRIPPGQTVTWTYRVSNIGNVAVDRADVIVTDDQPGVNPVFDSELTGNGDTIFNPGEVWWYLATGVAVPLEAAPDGVKTYPGYCTNGQTEDPRTAYINQGTVNIPGAEATAQSSYCNPFGLVEGYNLYLPMMPNRSISLITTPFRVTVGYEDLPLELLASDFDYNDFIVDIIGTGIPESPNSTRWNAITLSFTPNGRGAVLKHAFHMLFPAGTFDSNGRYTLTTFGPTGSVLTTQEAVFNAGTPNDFNIFPNTGEVFPKNLSNTIESDPLETAQRTAQLRITFDTPIDFNFADYDYVAAHGTGLFFDPYLDVLGSTEEVHRGDLRLLNVPEQSGGLSPFVPFEWPEERMRIDRVYTNITFIPNNPVPDIIFPNDWWLTHNNCVIDDVPCPLPVIEPSPINFGPINR